ncbi:MAG: Hsp20/alpha crystallin family protein [Proteobacteria bacterium]|nr:Hsp20/alpha crystallin family protein [Pseudomonadota bacterium]
MSLGTLVPRTPHVRSLWAPRTDVDRLLNGFWSDFLALPSTAVRARSTAFSPRIDVRETDEAFLVSAEIPGVEPESVEITIQEGVLTLKGEKHGRSDDAAARRTETFAGAFERRFRFGVDVLAGEVSAEARNGVLTVTVPKAPEVRPEVRTIPVTTG